MDTDNGEPPEWMPALLLVARDRSADGWMFTRHEDVRQALAERQLVAAVAVDEPSAVPDVILARIAVRADGKIATLSDPAGPPVPGPRLEEIVSGLAHELKAVIGVDGQVVIGTAGVPVESPPPGMTELTTDRRTVYAWPGTDRYVATAAAMGVKEELTWHEAEAWTVLASRHASERILTGLAAAMERFPRVTLGRKGPERSFEYVLGKGDDDLRLFAWWGPWLAPLHEDLDGAHESTREMLEMLAHPRAGQDEMDHHADLTEEQRVAVSAAMGDRDGDAFLARVCAAFDVPQVAARLAEQTAEDVAEQKDPDLVGEPVKPEPGRLGLARAAMKEMKTSETETPFQKKTVKIATIVEVVLGLAALAVAVFDLLPWPWWVWAIIGVLLIGDGLSTPVLEWWRGRRGGSAAEQGAPVEKGGPSVEKGGPSAEADRDD
ncbi:DUF2892 domain-containing protein [Ornithinimicrobium faecis]|uniref:DUF2892 domain-containing protein n=1 Tax=Ornithinimicrobium faecis TaxID=2934158 RepID=A0ABY4YR36_9MICO|nr:DUF2892 domain-containing protein [Ornithinimicrobium sp. HY1793]USQ79226.1 DUF2892 domain-containing protein [Ornithinimicrobium sp. HY1793]